MIKKKIFLISILSTFIFGCSFSKKSPDEVKAEAFDEVSKKMRDSTLDVREAAFTLSDFKVTFEDGVEPNQYSLVIEVPRKVSKLIVVLNGQKGLEFSDTNRAMIPMKSDRVGVDVSVATLTKDNVQGTDLRLGFFEIPKDLVISQDLSIKTNTRPVWVFHETVQKYEKIIIEEGVNITTNGLNLSLEANTIVFKGRNIIRILDSKEEVNHDDNLRQPLWNGSDITLKAKKIFGSASIYMIGYDGKNGQSAQKRALEMLPSPLHHSARNGSNGRNADYKNIIKPSMAPDISQDSETFCFAQPTNGENGQDGIIIHGEDGTSGGGTGDLIIEAEDYSQARFDIFFIPGQGGKGGEGNFTGQKGGQGGAPGKGGVPCKPAVAGKNGRDSTILDSKPGYDGQDGVLGWITVPQDSRHFNVIYELN